MHAWIKMNKNKIKERKKKLLVSFGSFEVSSRFKDMVAWRFQQRFVVASSSKRISKILSILEFFSLLHKPWTWKSF